MKNAEDLQVLVMTLKHRPDRYWYMLGMLGAMKFPFHKCHTVMGKYWGDYETFDLMVKSAIEDGFTWFERYKGVDVMDYRAGYLGNLWSACRCLRYISEQNHPYLITEDDRIFTVDWGEMLRRFKALPQDADTAILRNKGGDAYNEDWIKGAYPDTSGGTMVAYSPLGAEKALKIASSEETISTWENMAHLYDGETTYCSSERLYSSHPPFYSLSNAPGHMVEHGFTEFKGYGSHADYDRWVDGLDVDKGVVHE